MMYEKHLTVVLMPNSEVQFKPPYIYERYVDPYMRPRVRHAVKRFIERSMDKIESLEIRWAGHEPLLRMDVIEEISVFVKNILEFYGKRPYRVSVVTTGYFLDAIRVKQLLSFGIRRYQISLENPSEESEERRLVPEQVMKNLKELSELPPEYVFRVTLWNSLAEESDIEQFQEEVGHDSRIVLKRRGKKENVEEKEEQKEEEPRIAYVFRANGEIETFNVVTGKDRKLVGEVDRCGIAKFYSKEEVENKIAHLDK